MKLAEALALRADIQKRMAQLKQRMLLNARVQEGESPAESPERLMAEHADLAEQLEGLMRSINLTNARPLEEGGTMTGLLARRDCLRLRAEALREFLDAASATAVRGTRSEVIIRSTVNVAELRGMADMLSKELRELDMNIQRLNWAIELTSSTGP